MYLDFIKIEHTLFALPFAYAGALLAGKPIDARVAILILSAFTGLRTAAMVLNRIIDRKIDAKNPRTWNRHLPRNLITLREAYAITFAALTIYFISAAMINHTALVLSPIPAITAYIYPYLKRYTCLCHYVLGLNLAFAPLGGWVAVTDSMDFVGSGFPVLLLSIGVALWVAGFDMIYSLQDVEFDRKEGLHSLPAHFGVRTALWVSRVNHLTFLVLTAGAFSFSGISYFYLLPLAALLVFEHYVVRRDYDESRIQLAFFYSNAAISAVLLGSIFVSYALLRTL